MSNSTEMTIEITKSDIETPIKSFKFGEKEIRCIIDANANPWFIAKDICDILGYASARDTVNNLCRKTGVAKNYIPELSNTYNLIDEGNLYRLILKSNKPEAESFETWVCDTVLPSIRKTGKYELPEGKVMLDKEDYQQLLNDSVIIPRPSMYIMMCIEEYLHVRPKDVRGAVGYALGDLAKNVRNYDTVLSDPVAKELDKIIDFLHRPLTEYDVALINIEDLRAYFGFQKAAMQQHLIRAGLLDDNLKLTAFGAGLAHYIKGELWMIRKDTLAHFIEYAKARKSVMVQLAELGILK